MELAALIFLGGVFLVREWMNAQEKRDLMDRLMCRDFQEYKRWAANKRKPAAPVNMSDEQLAEAAEEHEA